MIKLTAKSPAHGLVPVTIGTATLDEMTPVHITFITPYQGQGDALSQALKSAHGMAAPAVHRATGRDGARAIWFGAQIALVGPVPDATLAQYGAVVDQSDGWCVLRLSGVGLEPILARLCPVDMRASVFKRGHVIRSQLQHMNVVYHRVAEDAVDIYGFRSMAQTMVHDITTAMDSIAAI